MSESMQSLYRRGMISGKQMGRMEKPAILKQTKPGVPAKMAKFDNKGKDQGNAHGKGIPEASTDEINERAIQDKGRSFGIGGRRGPPSKGARAGAEGQVKTNQINAGAMQRPKFPAGASVKGGNAKRPVGVKGPAGKSSGPQYGGPSSRANG